MPTAYENATRGLIGSLDPCVVKDAAGRVIWDNDSYAFLDGDCPDTVNPKLWRQSRLLAQQGLFEVAEGVYQVRGLDLSNMTLIEGTQGVLVVDPLISAECAAAALGLYRKHRGKRPVTAVMYSHPHIDHFGGAAGVLPPERGDIPIVAPHGFIHEAVSESIYVGPAMRRRAGYMYGARLPRGPRGQVGCGLGQAISTGTSGLVPPNTFVYDTGEEMEIDGVEFVFQMVPETEAPVEVNFYLPKQRALYVSECATHSLHNITTLRGALVRDAKAWTRYLDETIVMFGNKSDVLFAGHAWPTWGAQALCEHMAVHRDVYGYLHDQTLRMMNAGLSGVEIAEVMELPPGLRDHEAAQGFYGSVSHNVKGIYQRYMTWFDGNPAKLWQHPPAAEGRRYVELLGCEAEVLKRADEIVDKGDLRFAATLLDHALSANPTSERARLALANVLERLGFGAENATWRNFYLSASMDLRAGIPRTALPPTEPIGNSMAPVDQWLDCLSLRVDGPRAAKSPFVMFVRDPEFGRRWRVEMTNGVLMHREVDDEETEESGRCLLVTRSALLEALRGNFVVDESQVSGLKDVGDLRLLMDLCNMSLEVQGPNL